MVVLTHPFATMDFRAYRIKSFRYVLVDLVVDERESRRSKLFSLVVGSTAAVQPYPALGYPDPASVLLFFRVGRQRRRRSSKNCKDSSYEQNNCHWFNVCVFHQHLSNSCSQRSNLQQGIRLASSKHKQIEHCSRTKGTTKNGTSGARR